MKEDEYTLETVTRADGDSRRYPGDGNRHERRKANADARRNKVAASVKIERFTFRFARGTHVAGDVYVSPAVKVYV